MKDTSRSVLSSLCGYCLPSCQAERQAPGLLVMDSEETNRQVLTQENLANRVVRK